jgi:hypothetical protein
MPLSRTGSFFSRIVVFAQLDVGAEATDFDVRSALPVSGWTPIGSSSTWRRIEQFQRLVQRHFIGRHPVGDRCRALALFQKRTVLADAHEDLFAVFALLGKPEREAGRFAGIDLLDLRTASGGFRPTLCLSSARSPK